MDEIDYSKLQFNESDHWIWSINENQSYLGRIVMLLKRNSEKSFAQCTKEEWLDLQKQLQLYEEFMNSLFKPDRYNYSQLGNAYPKTHVHCVPRYKSERHWNNINFIDSRWGEHHAPSPPSSLKNEQLYELADWIKQEFSKFHMKHASD